MNKLVVAAALLAMLAVTVYIYYFNVESPLPTSVESLEGLPEELDSLLNEQGN